MNYSSAELAAANNTETPGFDIVLDRNREPSCELVKTGRDSFEIEIVALPRDLILLSCGGGRDAARDDF